MKNWESKLKTERELNNTFVVVSNGCRWLCNLINGSYIVKYSGAKLTDVTSAHKI